MSLVAAAVCPHPPAVVPEVAAGAAPELDDLRSACDAAVQRLRDSGARTIAVIGSDSSTQQHDPPFRGSFAPWGVPVRVGGRRPATGDGRPRLPLSLLVGAWLLERNPTNTAYEAIGVAAGAGPNECDALGAALHRSTEPCALLVMGDGSACRGIKAPGYGDPRAAPYDDRVAAALAGADAEALRGLDPALSAELRVAGRAPWQVLAGAVLAAGGDWRAERTYYDWPYGVAYFVAFWERA